MRFFSVFVILFIAVTILVCGCLGDEAEPQIVSSESTGSEGSFSPEFPLMSPDYQVTDEERLSLNGAFTVLKNSVEDGYLTGDNYSFRIIRGIDTDYRGNCKSWIAGAFRDGEKVLLRYTPSGWSENTWPGGLEGDEIDIGGIIMPFELFDDNSALISKALNSTVNPYADIEIRSDIYRITYNDNGSLKTLKFDSKTGAVI